MNNKSYWSIEGAEDIYDEAQSINHLIEKWWKLSWCGYILTQGIDIESFAHWIERSINEIVKYAEDKWFISSFLISDGVEKNDALEWVKELNQSNLEKLIILFKPPLPSIEDDQIRLKLLHDLFQEKITFEEFVEKSTILI